MTFRSTDREILALETSISGVIDGIAGVDLIRSADGGDSWEDVEAPQTAAVCTGPAGCIYLGTFYRGVMASRDEGRTWSQVSDSLRVYRIAADFSGIVIAVYEKCIYCSPDGGDSWREFRPVADQKYYYASRLAVSRGGELAVISNEWTETMLYFSSDCFATWGAVEIPFRSITSLRFGPDGHLFVAAYDPPGLYRSGRPLY